MKNKLIIALSGLVLNSVVVAVTPETTSVFAEYDYSGAYFNLGAGWGVISNLPTGAFAGSAAVGYNFNRYFALEAGWAGLPSQQWGKLSNYNLYTLNLKGTLPVSDTLSFYGKLGSGAGYSSWSGTQGGNPAIYQNPGSASSWIAQASVGTSLALSDHFNIYLENSSYFPIATEAGSFSTTNATFLGFQYNFSAPKKVASTAGNNYSQYAPPPPSPVISSATPPAVEASVVVTITATATKPASESASNMVAAPSLLAKNSEFQSRIKLDANNRQYVVIKRGETLYRLSVNSGLSQSQLRQINHLHNNTVVVGQHFYLD